MAKGFWDSTAGKVVRGGAAVGTLGASEMAFQEGANPFTQSQKATPYDPNRANYNVYGNDPEAQYQAQRAQAGSGTMAGNADRLRGIGDFYGGQQMANAQGTGQFFRDAGNQTAGVSQGYMQAQQNALGMGGPQMNESYLGMQGPRANIGLANANGANMADSRGMQVGQIGALNQFAQGPEGPSAAEALLGNQTAAAQRSNLALARSGRGTGSAASMRAALGQNANMQGAAVNQATALRANEAASERGQNLQALLGAQQGAQGLGGFDLNQRGQNVGLTQAQLQADIASRGQNFGLAGQQLQADLGARGQNLNYAGTLGNQALGWQNAGQGWAGLGNQQDQIALGYGQLGNAYNQTANQSNQVGLGYENLGLDWARTGQQGGMGYENTRATGVNAANIANAQNEQARDAATLGMAGGLFQGAMMASDERSKTRIQELENTNRVLQQSLQSAGAMQGGDRRAMNAMTAPGGFESFPGGRVEYPTPRQPNLSAFSQAQSGAVTEGDRQALNAARGTPAIAFDYRDPSMPGARPGRQVGISAQDLEQTPLGSTAVMDTPNGKMVDTGRLEMVNTGAINAQQQELDELARRVSALQSSRGSTADWNQFYGR